jgi:ATP-dependent protease HslVU (ClpYQ) peptidase subunit
MAPAEVVRASLEIAARICLFTNAEIALEEL